MISVAPLGRAAAAIAVMSGDELARRMSVLAPADEADRLKRRGFYVDMERGGGISEPSKITSSEVDAQLASARQATASASFVLSPQFQVWLDDPPADGLELIEDGVTAIAGAGDGRTPEDAIDAVAQAVRKYRARKSI